MNKGEKGELYSVKTFLGILVVTVFMQYSCMRDSEYPIPSPLELDNPDNPVGPVVIEEYLVINFNKDGSGINIGDLWTYSDGTEMDMTKTGVFLSPGKLAPDSSFRLYGTDVNASYWMGGCGHNAVSSFGLPNSPDKVYLNLDLYSSNATTNVEAYLIEDDGDVFKHSITAGATPQGAWTNHSFLVSDFVLDIAQSTGDGLRDDLSLLGKIQFTLLSGGGSGNTADLYMDNIIFTSGGPK